MTPETKHCKGCATEKSLDDFSVASRGKFGRAFYCRPCAAAKRRAYYASRASAAQRAQDAARMKAYLRENPEQAQKALLRAREWARTNGESVRLRNLGWRQANPEKAAAQTARYRRSHPEKSRELVERRRARVANAPVNDFTLADWRDVLEAFGSSCAYCLRRDLPLQQEHLVPLSKGGEHTASNIVPACGPCNNRKGTRDLLTFLTMGGKAA